MARTHGPSALYGYKIVLALGGRPKSRGEIEGSAAQRVYKKAAKGANSGAIRSTAPAPTVKPTTAAPAPTVKPTSAIAWDHLRRGRGGGGGGGGDLRRGGGGGGATLGGAAGLPFGPLKSGPSSDGKRSWATIKSAAEMSSTKVTIP